METSAETYAPEVRGPEQRIGLRAVFLKGSVVLGAASVTQRVLNFAAITLAARSGGPAILGAYSLALSTAGMVASYSGLSAGVTASRFIGQYPRDSLAYRRVLRIVALLTAAAAVIAAAALFIAAEPLARIALGDAAHARLLRFAAITVLVIIGYESLHGLLVGMFAFHSALWLAAVSGVLMVAVLSYAASAGGAPAMLVAHGCALAAGLLIAFATAWPSIRPLPRRDATEALPPSSGIVLFGGSQAIATVALALASWAVAVGITRYDPALHQMGFYMVGNQMKAMSAAAPNLVAQMVFPMLARLGNEAERQDRVIDGSTFISMTAAVLIGAALITAVPAILHAYGPDYRGAAYAVIFLVAMSVIQVCGVPATQYLTTLDLRTVTIINIVWPAALFLLALWLVPRHGAAGAGVAWIFASLVSQALVLGALAWRRRLPRRTAAACVLGAAVILLFALLAVVQQRNPDLAEVMTIVDVLLLMALGAYLWRRAQLQGYLHPAELIARLRR